LIACPDTHRRSTAFVHRLSGKLSQGDRDGHFPTDCFNCANCAAMRRSLSRRFSPHAEKPSPSHELSLHRCVGIAQPAVLLRASRRPARDRVDRFSSCAARVVPVKAARTARRRLAAALPLMPELERRPFVAVPLAELPEQRSMGGARLGRCSSRGSPQPPVLLLVPVEQRAAFCDVPAQMERRRGRRYPMLREMHMLEAAAHAGRERRRSSGRFDAGSPSNFLSLRSGPAKERIALAGRAKPQRRTSIALASVARARERSCS
jgi:hypothetical protein